MSPYWLSQLNGYSFLLVLLLQVASAVILLKGRQRASWFMLVGSTIALFGRIGVLTTGYFGNRGYPIPWISSFYALTSLGILLFAMGLLLHALHQRAKANRIAELEAIIASLQNR